MAQTVKFGIPYPLPTDPVSAGADDMRAIAETVDALPPLGYWTSPSAGIVQTSGQMRTANEIVGPVGPASESGIRFGGDATLYRAYAGGVKSTGALLAVGEVIAEDDNAAWRTYIGAVGGNAGVSFGGDVALYRAAAGVLKTDASLQATSDCYFGYGANGWGLQARADGTVYVAGALQTTGYAQVVQGTLYLGSGDTYLARQAANVLATSGALQVAGDLTAQHVRATGASDSSVIIDQAAAFPAPAAGQIKLFAQFNSGKLWLVAQWPGGARTTIAQEP